MTIKQPCMLDFWLCVAVIVLVRFLCSNHQIDAMQAFFHHNRRPPSANIKHTEINILNIANTKCVI